MSKTIKFNTGRLYSAEGQIIVATLHDDQVVTFFDHTRQIDGEFKLCGDRFDQAVVMEAYDFNISKGSVRAWRDGMQRGGCNTLGVLERVDNPEMIKAAVRVGDAEQAAELIREAEAQLGKLSDGQRSDLLADNFPAWELDYIKHVLADAKPLLDASISD